jgi:hypothetical protein
MTDMKLSYRVGTFREAGLQARWSKTRRGGPIIVARDPKAQQAHQRDRWWVVDQRMWSLMQSEGVLAGFDGSTLLGDIFSINA